MKKQLTFLTLTLRNFMSYGNAVTTIALNSPGTTQIQGVNLDDTSNGVMGNGTGKSTIVNAIVYAIYGEALSDSKVDDLINDRNNKNCIVTLTFILDDTQYTINRYRKVKSGPEGTYTEVFSNGDETVNLAPASLNETNQFLAELIGMPKELFIRLVVFDADEQSFFRLPALKQRLVMENLIQLTELTTRAEVIKESHKVDKQSIALIEQQLSSQEQGILKYTQQLQKAQERHDDWDNDHRTQISECTSELYDYTGVNGFDIPRDRELIAKYNLELNAHKEVIARIKSSYASKLQQLSHELDGIDTKYTDESINLKMSQQLRLNQLNSDLSNKQAELTHIKQQIIVCDGEVLTNTTQLKSIQNDIVTTTKSIESARADIVKLQHIIDDTLSNSKCHECNSNIHTDVVEQLILKRRVEIKSLIESINIGEGSLIQLQDGASRCDDALAQLTSRKMELVSQYDTHPAHTTIVEISLQLDQHNATSKQEIEELQSSRSHAKNKLTTEINSITQLQNDECANVIAPIDQSVIGADNEAQLTVLEVKIAKMETRLNDLKLQTNPHINTLLDLQSNAPEQLDYSEINLLKKRLDHQQFLVKLLTDKKSFIRKRLVSKQLPYLNDRLQKYLASMGLPYQVQFNSDLTPCVKRRGKETSFNNISHGQRARVNFCLSFAFRDVLERMNRKINLCILDEVLDKALCGVGTSSAVNLINEKAKNDGITIFVITHKSELSSKFTRIMTVQMENGFSTIQ